jgi:hypothetical protein
VIKARATMNIHIDQGVSRAAVPRVQQTVSQALRGHHESNLQVYVSRPRPGSWSVFIVGLTEHPLALTEQIETALAHDDH